MMQKTSWYSSLAAAFLLALTAHPLSAHVKAEPRSVSQDDGISTSRQNAITRAVKVCSPAIVGINITETHTQVYRDPFDDFMLFDPHLRRYFDGGRTYKRQYEVHGLGSGFLISSDGYIITNDHVAGNASKIVVTMTSGEKYDATIIGSDQVSDVALLKINGKNLPYLKLANSESVEVGEWAIAFGNPFGLFDINAKPTVTVGVVSNTGVDFTQPDDARAFERVYKGMIQTDAAISSGNSGGPLVNSHGEAIGMNTVIYSTSQSARGSGSIGIGFSIPINRVKRIADRLKKDGKIDRDFWTGMELAEIDAAMERAYGLKKDEGVVISQIMRNSPAEDARLEPGDVIVAIDGERIHRSEDVKVAILDAETDSVLRITVKRGQNEETLSLKLSARPRRGATRN